MLIAKQVGKCPQLSYQEMIDCFTPPIKSSFVNFYNEGASLVDACYFLRERGVLLEKYYPNEGIRPFNEIIRKRRDLDIPVRRDSYYYYFSSHEAANYEF